MKAAEIGEHARSFSLKDQNDNDFHLDALEGKKILLSFHPLAWTRICADQMKSLEEKRSEFTSLNTVPVGISVDSVPCKKAWAKNLGIKSTRLLADFWPHGQAAKLYGIFKVEKGTSERANIIINEKQKISFIKIYPTAQLPDIEEIISELKK